jgi:beta-N-acetylhexosaminidase
MSLASEIIVVGVAGPALTARERQCLEQDPPGGVILFRRNIETSEQLQDLAREIHSLPGAPLLFIDQEGGPVDRFRDLAGPSISARRAARLAMAALAGELAGETCAAFGIDVDLAPVVDRSVPGRGAEILGDRCFGSVPEEIETAGRQFIGGLERYGVAGVLKHFPGLGSAAVDSHEILPRISEPERELAVDRRPFEALLGEAPAWLVTHASYGGNIPATLDERVLRGLARGRLGFGGLLIADDLEMGALAQFGDLPERAARSAAAGCDLLPVCHSPMRIGEIADAVVRGVGADRLREANGRVRFFREDVARIRKRRRAAPRALEWIRNEIAALQARGAAIEEGRGG